MRWSLVDWVMAIHLMMGSCATQFQVIEFQTDVKSAVSTALVDHQTLFVATKDKDIFTWSLNNHTMEVLPVTYGPIIPFDGEKFLAGGQGDLALFDPSNQSFEVVFTYQGGYRWSYDGLILVNKTSVLAYAVYRSTVDICIYDWENGSFRERSCAYVLPDRFSGAKPPFAYSPISNLAVIQNAQYDVFFFDVFTGETVKVLQAEPRISNLGYRDFQLVEIDGEEYFAFTDDLAPYTLVLWDVYGNNKTEIDQFGSIFTISPNDSTIWWSARGPELVQWQIHSISQLEIKLIIPFAPNLFTVSKIILDPKTSLPIAFTYLWTVNIYTVESVASSSSTMIETSTPQELDSSSGDGGMSLGAILGIVLGTLGFLGLLGAAFFGIFMLKKRRRDDFASQSDDQGEVELVLSRDWRIEYSELIIDKQLGEGGFGVVYKAEWRNAPCVVKQMKVRESKEASAKARDAFVKEMNAMRSLRAHPNVCQLLGVCDSHKKPLCIVTEYMSEGSLWDLITNNNMTLTSDLIISFAHDTASGMAHLHSEDVLHCDLAARNLLVTSKNGALLVKVADFGLSTYASDTNTENHNIDSQGRRIVPIRWTSPEVFLGGPLTKENDVWAFGVTLWEICEREKPYYEIKNQTEVAEKVVHDNLRLAPPLGSHVTPEICQVIASCFTSAETRPTFQQLCSTLKH
eukprot:TRINITY_DN176_c0_g1_i11.p1 TRINITY_DN176_c0_g1~~TRINITY_DN176_c0_g1_i11.p1  ORF type:complete len:685 (+),score=101.09 TRINITY_DN176_c0_g1_i11:29-2083(+)